MPAMSIQLRSWPISSSRRLGSSSHVREPAPGCDFRRDSVDWARRFADETVSHFRVPGAGQDRSGDNQDMLDRYRAWLQSLPLWGEWLWYAAVFGTVIGILNRWVLGGVIAGVLFATMMTAFSYFKARRES
jgi:hypothetical protein